MDGPPRTPTRRPWPWGLLGMIALVMSVELSMARRAADFTPWGTWAWHQSGRAACAEAPGCAVLCFGDSLVKLGILPRVIEARLGKPAYNLSICAAQAPASYFLLRRALAAGSRPEAVLVDYKPGMLAGGPRDFARNWPELLGLLECLELSWTARDATFFASTALGLVFPSIRARHDLRVNILLALRGEGSPLREATLRYSRNWAANDGGQATAKNPAYRGDIDPGREKALQSHAFWCDRVNATYIRRFLELAEAHDIRVYWLLPPVTPVVQQQRERSGAEAKHVAFVGAMLARSPNLTVLDGRHAGYDHTVFIDPIHLDRQGACALTAAVADVMAGTPRGGGAEGRPRWVELPAYRDPPDGIVLEEIVDLNVALGAEPGRHRR